MLRRLVPPRFAAKAGSAGCSGGRVPDPAPLLEEARFTVSFCGLRVFRLTPRTAPAHLFLQIQRPFEVWDLSLQD